MWVCTDVVQMAFTKPARTAVASAHSVKQLQVSTYFSVPYERNNDFVGREGCIETIKRLYAEPKGTAHVALHGLGGVGYIKRVMPPSYPGTDRGQQNTARR